MVRLKGTVACEILAEAVRFELTNGCPLPVFKTGAIDHSATLPGDIALLLPCRWLGMPGYCGRQANILPERRRDTP